MAETTTTETARDLEAVRWAGEWFVALEEFGEYPYTHFGRLDLETGQVRWSLLHHRDFDGFAGYADVIGRQDGQKFPWPGSRELPRGGWLRKIQGLLVYLFKETKLRHTDWKLDYERNLPVGPRAPKFHVFSEEATAAIKGRAKAQGVSPQFYCLHALNTIISRNLIAPTQKENWWMVPINMRGIVPELPGWTNYSTYVSAQLTPSLTAPGLRNQVLGKLRRQLHWACWKFMLSGKLFGQKGIRKSLRYYRDHDHCWVGGHTFVEFDLRKSPGVDPEYSKRYLFVGTPPVTRSHPVQGVETISNGRLALALNSHPGLVKDDAELQRLVDEWAAEL